MSVKPFPVLLLLVTLIASTNGDNITDSCIDGTSLCLGIPNSCPTKAKFSCDLLVKLTARPSAVDPLEVQLYAKPNGAYNRWFAFGLSFDKRMGNDFVVHCNIDSTGAVTVGEKITIRHDVIDINQGSLTYEGSKSGYYNVNNLVYCHWTQWAYGGALGQFYDIFSDRLYLLLARGPIENGRMIHHSAKTISSFPIYMNSTGFVVAPNTIPLLVKLHGSLMTIAWVCFVSTSTMVARHYRKSWADSTLCGIKIWFAIHRGLNITAILFVAIGMISIFKHVGGWQSSGPHPWFGIFASILMILQPIGALLRPASDDPKRWYFTKGHLLGGYVAHLLALFAVYFSTWIDSISLSLVFQYFVVIFVIIHGVVHVIMNYVPYCMSRNNAVRNMIPLDGLGNSAVGHTSAPVKQKIEETIQLFLIIYIIFVHLAGVTFVYFILNAEPH